MEAAKKEAKKMHGIGAQKTIRWGRFITSLAVIIIIIAVAVALFVSPHVQSLVGAQTIYVKPGAYAVERLGNITFAIFVAKASNSSVELYLGRFPFLVNPALEVNLTPATSINVSVSGSGIADLNIGLGAITAKGAELTLTPLAASLGIKPSKVGSLLMPVFIGSSGGLRLIVTTTSTSTSTSTSTINQTLALLTSAINYANQNTSEGILMQRYNTLYQQDKVCNASVYNETYERIYGTLPSGSFAFDVVRSQVPIAINITGSVVGSEMVKVSYAPVFRNGTKQEPMLTLELNMSPSAIERIVNVTFSGILAGDNYTIVNNTYTFQSRISNFCGAYVFPPP